MADEDVAFCAFGGLQWRMRQCRFRRRDEVKACDLGVWEESGCGDPNRAFRSRLFQSRAFVRVHEGSAHRRMTFEQWCEPSFLVCDVDGFFRTCGE